MNKSTVKRFLPFALCILLAACGRSGAGYAPSEREEPPSAPIGVESLIEPLEASEPESSFPEDSSIESEDAGLAHSRPDSEPEPPEEKEEYRDERQAVIETHVLEAEKSAPVSEPELLHAVSPEKRFDGELVERELFRLVSAERAAVGAEALGIEENMRFAARIRAGEALEDFSHTRPDGTPYNTAFDEAGFLYAGKWHGENLSFISFTSVALNEKDAALKMFNELKDSPGHYRNMVSGNFLQTGIGVAVKYGDGTVYMAAAQLFSSF